MSAATIIAQAFGESANLYETVLGTTSDATPAQLRKAYYKRALVYHPDKQTSKNPTELEDAKLKFQAVSVAYSILADPDKRAEYDDSGELYDGDDDDIGNKSGMEQWKDYFRGLFGKVTTTDIDNFESKYKFSDEEKKDVLKYYKQFKGDLNKMIECVMLSSECDKKRWVEDYIVPAIESGEVKEYRDMLDKTMGDDGEEEDDDEMTESEDDADEEKKDSSNKKKEFPGKRNKESPKKKATQAKSKLAAKRAKEAAEAEDLIAKIRGNAVARRERAFDSLMAGLEERYSAPKKKKGSGGRGKCSHEEPPDIPDDEFERIQARLESQRGSKKKGKGKK